MSKYIPVTKVTLDSGQGGPDFMFEDYNKACQFVKLATESYVKSHTYDDDKLKAIVTVDFKEDDF